MFQLKAIAVTNSTTRIYKKNFQKFLRFCYINSKGLIKSWEQSQLFAKNMNPYILDLFRESNEEFELTYAFLETRPYFNVGKQCIIEKQIPPPKGPTCCFHYRPFVLSIKGPSGFLVLSDFFKIVPKKVQSRVWYYGRKYVFTILFLYF